MVMTRSIIAATAAVALSAGSAFAAGGDIEIPRNKWSFGGIAGHYDKAQLQRGFQVWYEVCAACHGLKYLAIRQLGDATGPHFPDEQVKAIAANFEVADEEGEPGDTRTAKPSDLFPANTGAGAPDLTLMAKSRAGFHGPAGLGINQLIKGIGGPEYIYSLLTGYTGKEKTEAGSTLYGNEAFAGGYLSMAPPLEADSVEYADGTEASLEQMSEDVAAFLMWAAEPKMADRKLAGFKYVGFLILLAVLFYFTNKKLWAPIKRKD